MEQYTPVPGPSRDDFGSLADQMTKKQIPITAGSGLTLTLENCYYMDGVVCLAFKVTGSISNGTVVASIPSKYAPSVTVPAFGISNADDTFRAAYIGTSGNITMYGSSSTDLRVTIAYIK